MRREQLADAGVTLLRTAGGDFPEIWCRCDDGPHGRKGISAHARADALSVVIRYAGVDILADPDASCYHVESAWRSYFRSTIVRARETEVIDDGDIASWTAEHPHYSWFDPSALHRRSVLLDRASRSVDVIDVIYGGDGHDAHLTFRLGPDVRAELQGSCAVLNWPTAPAPAAARLELPLGLRWSLHDGGTDPTPNRHVPACTLLGRGHCLPGTPLTARLEFVDAGKSTKSAVSRQAVSWTTSVPPADEAPEIRAEAI
jgi:Heparinase II/III-like protein